MDNQNRLSKFQKRAMLCIDAYKLGHMTMYPEKTEHIYVNMIPRSLSRLKTITPDGYFDGLLVSIGTRLAVENVIETFDISFFSQPEEEVVQEFLKCAKPFVGGNSLEVQEHAVRSLHRLGYLPVEFKEIPEGTLIPAGTPVLTGKSTHKDFAWVPNYLETFLSAETWKLSTAATIARVYKRIFEDFAEQTCDNSFHVPFQGHDFSSRGMSLMDDAIRTGIGHLSQFLGSDSVHSAFLIQQLYNVDTDVAYSVPASEHSVMCLNSGNETEEETFRRLIKLFPKGIVSIVSDTWDYWDTITNKALALKDDILARQPDDLGFAKVVFRPDTGNPVDVICGYETRTLDDGSLVYIDPLDGHIKPYDENVPPEAKGSVECLWEIFGGTVNDKGFKVLNPAVGLIYGDSITPQRAFDILKKLKAKGFAASNIVFGIGLTL